MLVHMNRKINKLNDIQGQEAGLVNALISLPSTDAHVHDLAQMPPASSHKPNAN
jgi:hypothetical protein